MPSSFKYVGGFVYVVFKGENILAVAPHGRSVWLLNRGRDWRGRRRGLRMAGGSAVVGSRSGPGERRVKVREENLVDKHYSDGHLSRDSLRLAGAQPIVCHI